MTLRCLLTAAFALAIAATPASAQTKVVFGTDWLAQAEHGGFYQALAAGIYKKHGLDVTIRMGGPQNNPLPADRRRRGRLPDVVGQFRRAVNMAQQDIPVLAVAAFFQKDPQVLISHPGAGSDTLAEMKGKPIMISAAARNGYWLFLRAKFGFTDDHDPPLHLLDGAVPGRPAGDPAGLRLLRAVPDRAGRQGSSRWSTCSPTTATPATPTWC